MKLLLNTIPLNPPLTGIGNYTLRLLEQYEQMPEFEHIFCFNGSRFLEAKEALLQHELAEKAYFQTSSDSGQAVVDSNNRKAQLKALARRVPYAYKLKQWYVNCFLYSQRNKSKNHLYHEPNFIAQKHKGPIVSTIHDLSVLHYPEYHPAERVKWIAEGMADTLQRAQHILTVSDVVREEIIEHYKVAPDRVHTTYLAADARFQPRTAEQTTATLERYGLQHEQYILFVGTIEPRKGVMDLLDAWEQLPMTIRQAYPLVLAGGAGWRNEAIMARIHKLSSLGEIRYLNYISNEDLPILLSGSLSFVFPAVYEGFGLPVLEAMASGAPVLCRQGTSMAKFAQGAVLLHDNQIDSLAYQLGRLIEDADLRQEYRRKGLARAAQFSWEKCAAQTLEVYQLCM